VTVAKPLAWQAEISHAGFLSFHQEGTSANRQLQPVNYQLNGSIYIAPPARYLSDTLLAQPVYPYIMPPEASVDIDTLADFLLAELLLVSAATSPSATLVET
jgi:CMP-N-acetylneuraminic acid synthetase